MRATAPSLKQAREESEHRLVRSEQDDQSADRGHVEDRSVVPGAGLDADVVVGLPRLVEPQRRAAQRAQVGDREHAQATKGAAESSVRAHG